MPLHYNDRISFIFKLLDSSRRLFALRNSGLDSKSFKPLTKERHTLSPCVELKCFNSWMKEGEVLMLYKLTVGLKIFLYRVIFVRKLRACEGDICLLSSYTTQVRIKLTL